MNPNVQNVIVKMTLNVWIVVSKTISTFTDVNADVVQFGQNFTDLFLTVSELTNP